jgi:hypothetical protein
MDVALRLVAEGLGDSYLPSAYTHSANYPDGLTAMSFEPAVYDTTCKPGRPSSTARAEFTRTAPPDSLHVLHA